MSEFIAGIITATFIIMIGYTVKINIFPEAKNNTKLKIYIDGNVCRVEREASQ